MTTLDSPSTILKNGETSKITSRENWRKDRKFTVIAMEGEVRGTATRDLRDCNARPFPFPIAPSDSIKRYLNWEENVTSVVTGRGLQMKKTKEQN